MLLPVQFWNDLRFALRQLRKSPGFTLTVLLTLGLCIGANTAIFTVVDRLFLRALPYPDPNRLVMVVSVFHKAGVSDTETSQDGRAWELIRDHAPSIDSAVYGGTSGVNLFSAGRVEYVQQERVSANFFHVLGIAPLIGREFSREEDIPGGPSLVLLSYGLWQRAFAGNPAIVGRSIDLRGAPFTVAGIMPETFRSDQPTDLWTPLQPTTTGEGSGDNYGVIGRLKPGVTFGQANGELTSALRPRIAEMHLPAGSSVDAQAIPLQVGLTGDLRPRVHLMWGAVGLVLLIGCVNIAGILLSRSASRSREIATRLALGAGRARILAQLLSESLLLALGGGVLGLFIGEFALRGLVSLNPNEFSMWGGVHLDLRVMAVSLAVSLATSILFGLFPAWEATAVDLRSALAEAGRGSSGGRRLWKRQALVFVEVALGVMLVVGAGLLIRTLGTLLNANPGFNPNHVLTASLSLQDARYQTTAAASRLFRETLERIRAIPGVKSAAVALSLPYQRPLNDGIQQVSGHSIERNSITDMTWATPGMFEALQIPLLRGRVFSEADNASASKVMVVNQAFVSRFFPNDSEPLGAMVKTEGIQYQIIGVVATVQQKNGWGSGWGPIDAFAQAYVPVTQISDGLFSVANVWFSPSWIVRTHGNVPGLAEAMRRSLQSVDPRLPFSSFQTLSQVRGKSLTEQRYLAALFSTLAGLAILLAALGLYGLVAQSVAQRTREMGIRLALGATTAKVVRTAVTPSIVLALAGIAAGLFVSLFATRLLKSLIWGVTSTDPLTFVTVALVLALVAALASLIPALRLTRLQPAQTLRDE